MGKKKAEDPEALEVVVWRGQFGKLGGALITLSDEGYPVIFTTHGGYPIGLPTGVEVKRGRLVQEP